MCIRDRFVNGTTINDISVGKMTVDEAKAKIQKTYTESYKLSIVEKGGKKELIAGGDIGYSAAVPEGLQAILDEQNATGRRWGPSIDNSHTCLLYTSVPMTPRFSGRKRHTR